MFHKLTRLDFRIALRRISDLRFLNMNNIKSKVRN